MLNISSGKVNRPQKVVVYGSEGIGKSTICADFPDPLFIDTEGGTSQMDVRRIETPATWEELLAVIHEVAVTPNVCKTLILDTADWAEQKLIQHVCSKYKKAGIEEFGYGKGYTYLAEEFNRLLAALDEVIAAGMNVVVTAHAKMRKFEQPDEMGAYDRWEMKLTKQVAPLLKEWSDLLLFANYKTFVVTSENDTKKAQGGKRVMYTSHHPCWDAKNRHGLPAEMDFSFSGIAHIFGGGAVTAPKPVVTAPAPAPAPTEPSPLEELQKLMAESKIIDDELRDIVAKKGHFRFEVPISKYPPRFITDWIIPNWNKIVDIIESDPNRLPF